MNRRRSGARSIKPRTEAPKSTAAQALRALRALANASRAKSSMRFFKAGEGEYAEGDRFLGITVPQIRALAKQHALMDLAQAQKLLASPFNESRLLALLIVVRQYAKADDRCCDRIRGWYLRNRRRVNNWNLVDCSAAPILGAQLLRSDRRGAASRAANRKCLQALAVSKSLWDRRIAVIATQAYIRAGQYRPTLRLARQLLADEQDLMHKACGWMLREIGDRSRATLEAFLRDHHSRMPRTMLRTAIEKLPPAQRAAWLAA